MIIGLCEFISSVDEAGEYYDESYEEISEYKEDGEFTVEFWARVPDWSASSKLLTIGNSASQTKDLNKNTPHNAFL